MMGFYWIIVAIVEIGLLLAATWFLWRKLKTHSPAWLRLLVCLAIVPIFLCALYWKPLIAWWMINKEDLVPIIAKDDSLCDDVAVTVGLYDRVGLEGVQGGNAWGGEAVDYASRNYTDFGPPVKLHVYGDHESSTKCFPWLVSGVAAECLMLVMENAPKARFTYWPYTKEAMERYQWRRVLLSDRDDCPDLIRERARGEMPDMSSELFLKRIGPRVEATDRPLQCVSYVDARIDKPTLAVVTRSNYDKMIGGIWRFRGEVQLVDLKTGMIAVRSRAAVILEARPTFRSWENGWQRSRGRTLSGVEMYSLYRKQNCGVI